MRNKNKSAVEWFYDKIKSHFDHDGELVESVAFTMAIAKQKERDMLLSFAKFIDKDLIDNVPAKEIVERFLSKK